MLLDDNRYLGLVDGAERLLAKILGLVLLVVMAVATVQLVVHVFWAFMNPQTPGWGKSSPRCWGTCSSAASDVYKRQLWRCCRTSPPTCVARSCRSS